MTIPRVQAAGDPFAVGLALGRHAKRAIHEELPRVAEFRDLGAQRGGARLAALEAAARSAFPRYLRELEGLAAGADFDLAHLLAWNCRGEFRFPADAAREDAGCTTVLLPGASGGPAIIAHNEDGDPELHGHCFLAEVSQDEGPGFTAFCYPGMLPGNAFGINAHGLVQSINHIQPDDLRDGIARQFAARAVLDCADLDAALAVLARPDRAGGFHHALARAGESRVLGVEAPPERCYVKTVEQPYVHANHLIEPPFAASAQTISESSSARQARGERLLEDGARDGAGACSILFDRADPALPIYRRKIDGVDGGFTLATALFEIHDDRVDWWVYFDADMPPCQEGRVVPG